MGAGTVVASSTVATIAATSTIAAAANGLRRALILQNDSDETIYVALGEAAVMNSGHRLDPYAAAGGQAQVLRLEGPSLFTGAVYAICASGSKKLLVTEIGGAGLG